MKKGKSRIIKPNLVWYKKISLKYNLSTHCPFANINRCPIYFISFANLKFLGATGLDKEEEKKILEYWKKNELFPKMREEEPSVYSGGDGDYVYGMGKWFGIENFCPEVTGKYFGLFATVISRYVDELDVDNAQRYLTEKGIGSEGWRWNYHSVTPHHHTDCLLYSLLLVNKKKVKEKINITDLSNKQKNDYKKHEYKCKDQIYVPGTSQYFRSNDIVVNKVQMTIGDSILKLLLRFLVELKKRNGGWVSRATILDENIFNSSDPDNPQGIEDFRKFYELRKALKGYLLKKDSDKFIENDRKGRYRISTHPDFITYNKKKLLNHKDPKIRKLAEELP